MPKKQLADIEGKLMAETERAYRIFSNFTGITAWAPKSIVEYDEIEGTFTMPYEFAEEKGFI